MVGTSCTLDLLEDPNAVQPNESLPSLQLNSMQRSLAVLFQPASTFGMQMTRLQNVGSSLYDRATTPEDMNGMWGTAYANLLMDANALIKSSDAVGYARHAGMSRIIEAYVLLLLVDYFGDVPYSKAFAGSANFNPGVDPQTALYDHVITSLDKAKVDLRTGLTTANPAGYLNPITPPITDLYYNNDYGKWIRLANTLKLKVFLNKRLIDVTGSTTAINALIAETPVATATTGTGGFISAANENFVFRYGLTTADPDGRHPRFIANYPAGGGNYMSNWLIWHMFHGYDAVSTTVPNVSQGDPRMRFYFYRQALSNSTDINEIRCITQNVPSHYPSSTGASGGFIDNSTAGRPPMGVGAAHPTMDATDPAWTRTFCYPTNIGYWGRDHVDPQGIPPDGLLRTAWGVYPAGGRFDANNGAGVTAAVGQRGAGFQPIMMRSFVQFMLSEAALFLGTTGDARTHFQNGIQNSLDDVRTWATTGTFGTTATPAAPVEAVIGTFYPAGNYTTDRNNYVAAALAAYDDRLTVSPSAAMNYVAREYWIAAYGNGVEAYNLYRRTGQPSGMQPVVNPTPGDFPRSFWYPANSANLNSSIDQKPNLTIRVFWDTNSTNLNF